jgi:hypothetical protein
MTNFRSELFSLSLSLSLSLSFSVSPLFSARELAFPIFLFPRGGKS